MKKIIRFALLLPGPILGIACLLLGGTPSLAAESSSPASAPTPGASSAAPAPAAPASALTVKQPPAPGVTPAAVPLAPARAWKNYAVILERSMFTRQEAVKPADAARPSTSSPAPAGTSAWMLTGIVLSDLGPAVAFLENTQSGSVLRAQVGQTTSVGQVQAISSAGIELLAEGQTRQVKVGFLTDGSAVPQNLPPAAGAASSAGEGGSLLEKLKARRNKELGK